tara:strand:- start:2675 stop:3868 length:1194 start_codon:yes stop_codon:yes gene_type:complete
MRYLITILFFFGFPFFTQLLFATEYQMWVTIGQSLLDGPISDELILTSADHDSEILEYKYGRPLKDYNTVADVIASYGQVSPAEVFARRLFEKGERNIVLVRLSPGGHSITAFLDESRCLVPKKSSNLECWPLWVDFAKDKIDFLEGQGHTVVLRGVIMFQGSSDGSSTYSSSYEEHLRRLKADARERFGMPELQWLQVRSPDWGGYHAGIVRVAQVQVTEEDPYAKWISSDSPMAVANVFLDGTHPDMFSSERIGVTWADGLFERFPTFRSYMAYAGLLDYVNDFVYDSDSDGVGAYLEYAFGGDLTSSDFGNMPRICVDLDGDPYYEIIVRVDDPLLAHSVLFREELISDWIPVNGILDVDANGELGFETWMYYPASEATHFTKGFFSVSLDSVK